ncbi:LysR family transcriptional regulator [Paenibacillus pasadenensis]|uniref:LysR family transcriptional regulator n=1 Tax=Paenibacillus pasadenensis TaxID=217090 RepID=UPI00204104E6|nr:LysR family transcriptional regulator [Paenibacillus pasadenensis]MCM3746103.1 LysR family transcriptional regulator [Paenibacillus pasadenensis]
MNPNLEWYRVFYWIARSGSLTRAAERLHITQPAVSHSLKQLEQSLGGPLFVRNARGVSLTAEGEVLLRHVEEAFRFLEKGEKQVGDMNGLSAGEIRIGAGDTLCRHFLLGHLERFRRLYPAVGIRVMNRTTPETAALLKEGLIDLGLISLPHADSALELRPGPLLHDCLVAGEAFRHLAKRPLPLQELGSYPLLMLESGSTRRHLDQYAVDNGALLQPELELGSLDLLSQFAQRGFGIAFQVREYISDELTSGALTELPLDPPVPPRRIAIATRKEGALSAACKAFLELLPL